jgi:hypothetical protein
MCSFTTVQTGILACKHGLKWQEGIMISDISNLLDSGKFVEHFLDSDDIELSDMDKNSYTNFTEQRVIHCYLTLEVNDMCD